LPASVPSLAAALEACAPLGVNVEIKNSPNDVDFDPTAALVAPTVAVIRACSQPIIVSSRAVQVQGRVIGVLRKY
ncbi:MAG: hypothetical protein ACXWCX_29015, partial [Burkholderiales bacterium]